MNERQQEALRRLAANPAQVGVDVETSGLDWRHNHICGWVLSFGPSPADSYYLPVRHRRGGNIEGVKVPEAATGWDGSVHPVETEILKHLDRKGLKVLGHNLSFDLKFAYRVGYKFNPYHIDTMVNACLINEWQVGFSLEKCANIARVEQKKTDIYEHIMSLFPAARVAGDKKAMGWFWELAGDDPKAVEYAEGDGVTTWQLDDWQNRELVEQQLLKVHDIECRMIGILARMTTRGIKIDQDRLAQVRDQIKAKLDEAAASLPAEFNSRAPTQVQKLLVENGHDNWPMTAPTKNFPRGRPSFTEAYLLTLPIGRQIINIRKYSNLLSSFIDPMINTHMWNGRVHPEYNQLRGDEYGTITGRLSSSNPNLQQINKRNVELGKLHRSIFVPDDGRIWGSPDYSQCEPRLLAYYSRCKVLFEGYTADPPVDAHTSVAVAISRGKWDAYTDDEKKYNRENGKRVNQTLITGGGKRVICEKYGVDPAEVDQIWTDYFETMPEIRVLQRRASERMHQRGYVISLLGRRSRLNDPSKSYVAVNRLLQCGNADIVKQKMVEVDDYLESEGRPIDLLNSVHDALDYQFEEGQRKHYTRCLEIMTSFGPNDVISLDIPMKVDAGEGKNWAEATYTSKT